MNKRHSLWTILAICVGLLPIGREAAAQNAIRSAKTDTAALHRTLDSLAKQFHGSLSYTVYNLESGERLERRGDEPFPTASLIKVPVLVALFAMVEKSEITLADRITLLKADKVQGSGTLQFLHDGIDVTVYDAAWLMTTLSDNTATNLLLDKVPMRRVWKEMEARGMPRSKIHHKVFLRTTTSVVPDSSAKYGLGVTTSNEMAHLFALLADGKAVSPHADSVMLDILDHNEDRQKLQRFVVGVSAPHKTGSDDDTRTECALFRLQSRVVACVLTKDNVDKSWGFENEAELTMSKMGLAITTAWPKKPAPK